MANAPLPYTQTAAGLQPMLSLSSAFVDNLMQAQRAQLEAMLVWQKSIAATHQELWDEWVAHFGGGVPIDV